MEKRKYRKSGFLRHIRWNWEPSPDNSLLVRYTIIVVDDKKSKETLSKIFQKVQKFYGGLDIKRTAEGKVAGIKLRYLFQSFDTPLAPSFVQWHMMKKLVIQDDDLYERKNRNIEDFVEKLNKG